MCLQIVFKFHIICTKLASTPIQPPLVHFQVVVTILLRPKVFEKEWTSGHSGALEFLAAEVSSEGGARSLEQLSVLGGMSDFGND